MPLLRSHHRLAALLPNQGWAYAGLVLAMVIWSSSFVALKIAFRSYDPMVVIFGRMAVASICFAALMPGLGSVPRLLRRDYRPLLFMTLCEPCLYFVFEARAMALTTASQAGMITAILPLMVAVGARVVLREPLSLKTSLGFVVAMGGACWLSLAGQPSLDAPNPLLGNFLEFLAMVCATGYIISLKWLTARYSPFFLSAMQAFAGAIFFCPFLFLPSTVLPATIDPLPTMAIVYLGAVVTLGAYALYNYGVSRIPVSRTSVFFNLIPVVTVLLGVLVLNERFSLSQCGASGLVFVGIFMSQRGDGKKAGRNSPTAGGPQGADAVRAS